MKHNLKIILWTCYGLISLTLLGIPLVLEYFGKSKMMMHRFLLARNADITSNFLTTPVLVGIFFLVLIFALGLVYALYISGKRIAKHSEKKSGLTTISIVALPSLIAALLLMFNMLTGFDKAKAPSFFIILWGAYIFISFVVSLISLSVNNFIKKPSAPPPNEELE